MKEVNVKVQGMSHQSSVPKIKEALHAIGAEGNVNLKQGSVDVRFDEEKLQISQVEQAIRDQGYNVEAYNAEA